ncbi:MAG: RNA 2',3'-cyclic phosphodiesterase [Chloroflexi bacterium]|nr:RNA 2',3'-cyclic phosphodiesterase [Chloroflexota bacterium]MBI1856410.1 RNA 2',3'-cyclic phosphodiesterase [Chloroflexota bacterium]MBI3340592.1 RNA 2',3'-cyclic phosphodiesterase [Chloroflexota bacterium]
MNLVRAFIALEVPTPLHDAIQTATAEIRKTLGSDLVRWTPATNIHLTLKFLGDVSPANIEIIKEMLAIETAQYPCFDMSVEGIGSFPTPRRPRVLWVGLNLPASFASLQRGIETASARLGYPAEEHGFSPHLTIGRVRQNPSSADLQKIHMALEDTKIGSLGTGHINAIHLFKSDLQPGGSVYTRLFTAPLRR